MKDAFNEGLPYITHFVVLHPFLRRPQILLTFTTQLTLIKSNLRKKSAFSLEYSSNNSILLVYIVNCSGYLPYMLTLSFFIVITLNMVCVYLLLEIVCQKIFFNYFLKRCIMCFVLYPLLMLYAVTK